MRTRIYIHRRFVTLINLLTIITPHIQSSTSAASSPLVLAKEGLCKYCDLSACPIHQYCYMQTSTNHGESIESGCSESIDDLNKFFSPESTIYTSLIAADGFKDNQIIIDKNKCDFGSKKRIVCWCLPDDIRLEQIRINITEFVDMTTWKLLQSKLPLVINEYHQGGLEHLDDPEGSGENYTGPTDTPTSEPAAATSPVPTQYIHPWYLNPQNQKKYSPPKASENDQQKGRVEQNDLYPLKGSKVKEEVINLREDETTGQLYRPASTGLIQVPFPSIHPSKKGGRLDSGGDDETTTHNPLISRSSTQNILHIRRIENYESAYLDRIEKESIVSSTAVGYSKNRLPGLLSFIIVIPIFFNFILSITKCIYI